MTMYYSIFNLYKVGTTKLPTSVRYLYCNLFLTLWECKTYFKALYVGCTAAVLKPLNYTKNVRFYRCKTFKVYNMNFSVITL